ncbi:MAG: NADH-quinone oxidoreductase subunit J [Ignavibacteriae bacterium]|nr:NADH-quinone oxidoreductase subunit J [Ignavibacteria bacterium]MBI3363962.1 NADH-quinone oxidoreductase subunit J [Ignavibacteriota bacterium]
MNFYDTLFYFFAIITLVSAGIVVFSRNIIYSAFSLLFTFFGVAGIYVLLNADFIAVSQLLIYVGGILVLLLFGVMLTNKVVNVEMKTGTLQTFPASILVAVTAGALCAVFYVTDWKIVSSVADVPNTANILGEMFMTTYILPFEVISIVLLVALVGAALIARKETPIKN